MPYVLGGEKCNFTTGVTRGDGKAYQVGQGFKAAQTFNLYDPLYIYRCALKTFALFPGIEWALRVYPADADGKPTGAPLAFAWWQNARESAFMPGKWKGFDFVDTPLLEPARYCLVLDRPSPWPFTEGAWTAVEGPEYGTYQKAWWSADDGATWDKIPYTSFLFQVWGWSPPPVPPPLPCAGNWAVIAIAFNCIPDGYEVVVTTNNKCHLYMRWTNTLPLKHPQYKVVRGLQTMSGTRFCFVSWYENEQEEDGDTYFHSFIKTGWPVCQPRWFYFTGLKQCEVMPSTTAVFYKHRTICYYNQLFKEPWTRTLYPPPLFNLIYQEPWTTNGAYPPQFSQLFYEPWTS